MNSSHNDIQPNIRPDLPLDSDSTLFCSVDSHLIAMRVYQESELNLKIYFKSMTPIEEKEWRIYYLPKADLGVVLEDLCVVNEITMY